MAAHRKRRRVTALGSRNGSRACNGSRAISLTPELRAWLRCEVDRRKRERLEREDAAQREQDALLVEVAA